MAQQQRFQEPVKWKLGSKCDLFVRDTMQWAEGEIIGSFSVEKKEWIKVRCGQRVHDVLCGDPDLREREQDTMVVSMEWIHKLKEFQEAVYAKDTMSTTSIIKQLLITGNSPHVTGDPSKGMYCITSYTQYTLIMSSFLSTTTLPTTGSLNLNWFNVVQCVSTELFPVLSVKLSQCVQEKLASDIDFQLNDFGEDSVNDIMERLKEKRAMNNKEILYLRELIQRACDKHENQNEPKS